jgi:nucleotide-binding universal stress UspA family protein
VKRFTNILYSPSNRSHDPAALARVVDLATRNSAKLTLFGVVAEPTRLQRLFDRQHLIEQTVVAAEHELLEKLTSATAHVSRDQVEVIVEVGRPVVAIIERVLTGGHDLVVVNDSDASQAPSVKRLLRKCPCPVWVIKPTRHTVQRVLAAVNPHPGEADLNRLILELASSMVSEFGGQLHVGHAWEVYGDSSDGAVFDFTPAVEFDQLHDEVQTAHTDALVTVLADGRFADAPWQVHVERGPADDVIPQMVRKYDIDLLVMGTIARSGIDGVVIGNTAERILGEVRCSVLAVKPDGFVSPIHAPTRERS